MIGKIEWLVNTNGRYCLSVWITPFNWDNDGIKSVTEKKLKQRYPDMEKEKFESKLEELKYIILGEENIETKIDNNNNVTTIVQISIY